MFFQNKSKNDGPSFSFNFGGNDEPKDFSNSNTAGTFQDLSKGNRTPKRNRFNFGDSLPSFSPPSFGQSLKDKPESTGGFGLSNNDSFRFKSELDLPSSLGATGKTKSGNLGGLSSANLKGLFGLFGQNNPSPLEDISSTAKGFGANLKNTDFLFDGSSKATPPVSFNFQQPSAGNTPDLLQNASALLGLKEAFNPIQPSTGLESIAGNLSQLAKSALDEFNPNQTSPNPLSDILSGLTGGQPNSNSPTQTLLDRTGNLNLDPKSLIKKRPHKIQKDDIDPNLLVRKLSNKALDSDFDRDSKPIGRDKSDKLENRPPKTLKTQKEKIDVFGTDEEPTFSDVLGDIGLSVVKATMGLPEKGLNILDFTLKNLGGEERFKNSFWGKTSKNLREKTFNRAKAVINEIQELNGKRLEKNGFLKALSGTFSFVAEMAIEAPFDIATKLVSLPKDIIISSSQTYTRVYDETLKQFKNLSIEDAKAKAESRATFATATNLAPIIFKHLGGKAEIFQPKGNKLDPVREFFGNLINGAGSDAAIRTNENNILKKEDLLNKKEAEKIGTDNIKGSTKSLFNNKLESKFPNDSTSANSSSQKQTPPINIDKSPNADTKPKQEKTPTKPRNKKKSKGNRNRIRLPEIVVTPDDS